ncbi:MAG: hypothetical protein WC979_09940 [Candidatus Pacearchaeota archaeon]|jgi:hypothetical protein
MKTGQIVVIMLIASVLLAGLIFGGIYLYNQSAVEGEGNVATECGDSTGKLTVNAYSALNPSTNVTPTLKVGVNGGVVSQTATSGTTTFAIGDKLEIHGTLSDYIDTSVKAEMTCGGIIVDMPMYYSTSDNPAIRIKNDDGDYVSDNIAGLTTNQTNLAVGETLIMDIEFAGTSLESSGDGVYVIEFPASTNANITSVELTGATSTTLPSVHSLQNAGSKYAAFNVPAVVGSEKAVHTLTVNLGATMDLSGGVYTDWYSKQSFIDDDGTIKVGVEDSDGTAKYENTLDFDFYINAA